MVDYENLYHIMVRTIEIALENLKAGNVWDAARKLEMGEQICEEIYIATAEDNPQPPMLSLAFSANVAIADGSNEFAVSFNGNNKLTTGDAE